jgi:tetratricopeptide (TPR) repeat protein
MSEALTEFHKEQEITPTDSRSYKAAASLENFTGQKDKATQEWQRLLKADPKSHEAALNLSQALYEKAKYPEAAAILEDAVKVSPSDSETQLALGYTYLKMGQSEKAVSHIRAAAEEGGSPRNDPMFLNNVAYTLAENNSNLELARQYGEEALKALDKRSQDDVAAVDTGTQVTYQLSMLWDTLGWVYFKSGDTNRSESFVRAAWLLGQDAIVGEHLGEIFEKQGKNKEAAHAYELALAALGSQPFRMMQGPSNVPLRPQVDVNGYEAQRNNIISHYQKLTGRKPSIGESRRLPNGEWTKTVSEQLSQIRTTRFGKQPNLSGSAEFLMVFTLAGVESVEYRSGSESLQSLSDKIKAAHYQVEFPVGSTAKILRRAEISCTSSAGCMAVLIPPTPPQMGRQ